MRVNCIRSEACDKSVKNLLTEGGWGLIFSRNHSSQPMKKILLSSLVAAAFAVGTSFASVLGTETGASWTTATWTNGATSTLGNWFLVNAPGSSTAIGNSSQGGRTSIGASAFNLIPGSYTNSSQGYVDAYFALNGGALTSGQTLSFDLNFLWNNGTKGFALQTAGGGTTLLTVQQNWSDPVVAFGGGLSGTNTILGNGFQQAITLQAAQSSGSILFNVLNNGTNILTQNFTTADAVGQVRFFAGNIDPTQEGNAQNHSIYFNNLSVVPEPSTYALLGLSALALGGYVARRRARK